MEQESPNPAQRPPLDEASRIELRMLLLLEWMMGYDQLHVEKKNLENTLRELEEQVTFQVFRRGRRVALCEKRPP